MTHQPQAAPAPPPPPPSGEAPDWSATQYLKFGSERTRAVRDLVANIPLQSPRRIIDLGCGPGNSTAVLAARWPAARLSGVDSSPDMLARARASLPGVELERGDLRTWQPPGGAGGGGRGVDGGGRADLLFSNAVLHWLRRADRVPTALRLLRDGLAGGGVLALQVPDNHEEPSHRAMREVALGRDGPWRAHFEAALAAAPAGAGGGGWRPDLDPVEPPAEWYDALAPACARVDVWHVLYQHVLEGPGAIVEWVRGTGLMPFLGALPAGEVRDAYARAYEERLAEVYPRRADGKVMLRYPRLFVVATKK